MVIIINAKDFAKKPKKIIELRDYHLINGSSNDKIMSISEGETVINDLQPQRKAFDEKRLSKEENSAKIKKFVKGEGITMVCARAMVAQIKDPDSNVYIILNKKVYEYIADKLIKRFNKMVKLDEGDLFVKYSDFDIMCEWYRKHVQKELDHYNDKYDKVKYDSHKSLSTKSEKLSDLNDRLDKLQDAYDAPDKLKARKAYLHEAKPSKGTIKKMKKWLDDRKDQLMAIESEKSGFDLYKYE